MLLVIKKNCINFFLFHYCGKKRKGAFWEDRYHATAIQSDEHLAKCMVYIDLNIVRAGVMKHPGAYKYCGYNDIQNPQRRYRVIDLKAIKAHFSITGDRKFQKTHREWVEEEMRNDQLGRISLWSEAMPLATTISEKIFVVN